MEEKVRQFRLVPFFSVASLASIVIVAAIMAVIFRDMAMRNLTEITESQNTSLTFAMAGALWPYYSEFLTSLDNASGADIRARPELDMLMEDVQQRMHDLPILKVKIYDLRGLTVFSTDIEQIGEDRSTNSAFLRARHGETVSSLVFRDEIYAFEGGRAEHSIVTSYVPVRNQASGQIEGVFELYSDVTPLVRRLNELQVAVFGGIVGVLLLLYVVLLLFIQHADRLIRRQEQTIAYRAHFDELTGLPNRVLFRDQLQRAMERAQRDERLVALLFIDMDRFKVINDTLGHEVGDEMLREVALRLRRCVRRYDTAARLGGDEFTVILEGVRDMEEVDNVAARLVDELGLPYLLQGKERHSNASIGITIYPFDDDSLENLLKNADIAMYRAKRFGGDQFVYYSDAMQQQLVRRHEIEQGLREALSDEQLHLVYQPKVDLHSGRPVGLEALIRWEHPQHGLIMPGDFVAVAEESHLISRLGEWVMRRACQDFCAWKSAGLAPIPVSINVSPRQFLARNFVCDMRVALKDCCVAPDQVELEITESILVEQHDETAAVLRELQALGVRVALDDFGTGYSSLRYLRELPVDVVKIDRSFIQSIHQRTDDAELVQGMIALARSLHQDVVAEGVELEDQAEMLRTMGCHTAQGYLFSPPLPASEIPSWIESQNAMTAPRGRNEQPLTERGAD